MKQILSLLALLTYCSCSTSDRIAHVPPGAPTTLNKDFRRAHHEAFSTHERDIIAAAWHGIRQSRKLPNRASKDAYYRVRHSDDGYDVFVIYVTGYDGSRPLITPCVHNEVLLSEDGSVLKVLTGPECWP